MMKTTYHWPSLEELHPVQQPPHRQQQLHHQPLQPHLQMAVDPHTGPMICGVMMKTTMLIATGMVELVASMKLVDGIITAQIVSVKNVHHLDGGVITTVMII